MNFKFLNDNTKNIILISGAMNKSRPSTKVTKFGGVTPETIWTNNNECQQVRNGKNAKTNK